MAGKIGEIINSWAYDGGQKLTQDFNPNHDGVDIGTKVGVSLYTHPGKTATIYNQTGIYGENYVVANYSDGTQDLWVHLNNFSQGNGAKVGPHTLIGKSGNTGIIPGFVPPTRVPPHLHFTHRTKANIASSAVDPYNYMKGGGVEMATINFIKSCYEVFLGRPAAETEAKTWLGQPSENVFNQIASSPERKAYLAKQEAARKALVDMNDSLSKQIQTLQQDLADALAGAQGVTVDLTGVKKVTFSK